VEGRPLSAQTPDAPFDWDCAARGHDMSGGCAACGEDAYVIVDALLAENAELRAKLARYETPEAS